MGSMIREREGGRAGCVDAVARWDRENGTRGRLKRGDRIWRECHIREPQTRLGTVGYWIRRCDRMPAGCRRYVEWKLVAFEGGRSRVFFRRCFAVW